MGQFALFCLFLIHNWGKPFRISGFKLQRSRSTHGKTASMVLL